MNPEDNGVSFVNFNVHNARCAPKRYGRSALQPTNERRRQCRAEIVESGIDLVVFYAMVALYLKVSVTSHPKDFAPSCDRELFALYFLSSAEHSRPKCIAVYSSDSQKRDCTNAIASDKKIVKKVRQVSSEDLSFPKKRCRNLILKKL